MKRLLCKFQLGAIVYHRVDPDAGPVIVVEIRFAADGGIEFVVVWDASSSRVCCELELTTARSFSAAHAGEGDMAVD